MVLAKVVKAYPEKNGVSIRGSEWSVWIRKVETKEDKRTMFLIKPLKCVYEPGTEKFSYEDMAAPIWLTPSDIGELMQALGEL